MTPSEYSSFLPQVRSSPPQSGTWRVYDATDGLIGGIRCLHQDSRGFVWIGTRGCGLYRFDGRRFERIPKLEILPSPHIEAVLEDDGGSIWLATMGGLVHFAWEIIEVFGTAEGLPHEKVWCLCLDHGRGLWCGTESGIACLAPGGDFLELPPELSSLGAIKCLLFNPRTGLWFGGKQGLFQYWKDQLIQWTSEDGLPSDQVHSLLEDSSGRLWVGTEKGLALMEEGILSLHGVDQGLEDHSITGLWEDSEGLIWIGAYGAGVVCFDGTNYQSYDSRHGLAGNRPTSFLHDREGLYLFGEETGGLSQLDRSSFHVLTDAAVSRGLLSDEEGGLWFLGEQSLYSFRDNHLRTQHFRSIVSSLLVDSQARVWVGSREGLHLFHNPEAVWAGEDKLVLTPDGREKWAVGCLLETSHGTVLAVEEGIPSLYRYSSDGASVEDIPFQNGTALYEDREGRLWLAGEPGEGFALRTGERWTLYGLSKPFHEDQVLSFHQNENGEVWICSEHAAWKWQEEKGVRILQQLYRDGSVFSCQTSGERLSWWGTPGGGLIVFNGESYQRLSVEDGLPSNTITSLLAVGDGEIVVGTPRGLARYNYPPPKPPLIHLQEVISDRVYSPANVLDIPLSHAALLTFHFVGLGLATSRLRYRYRLSGWDKEWRETDAQQVRYEDLPRGEYHFEVFALNRDLVRSQSPAQVRIRLVPDSRENDITRFESQIAQFEQMLESEQRIALLNKVLVDLGTNSSLWEGDFDVALRHIAEVSARAIGVTRVGIWMVNSDETALDCWESFDARTGQHTSGDRLELADHRGYYDALQHNRIIDATEAASDPRTFEFADSYLIPNQIHSLLDAPIRIEGRTVGVVCHEFAGERHEWGLEEKFFVVSIVDFIALAYERWHRKKTEEGLQHTHRIYRAAIESIRGIPYVVNLLEDRYEFFGEASEEILGVSSDAITPGFFRDRTLEVTPSDPRETRASEEYIRDFLEGKMDRFRMDMRYRHPDGRVLWLTDAAIPIRNPETGKIESDLGIILDITDRKLAEERIERTQRDYHQAIQVAGAVPYRQSYLTNRYDFLGTEIEELTGYRAEEFSPEIWDTMIEEIVLLGDLENFSVDDAVEVARSREGISWRADFRVRTKDGSEKWISNSAIQIHDEEGKVVGSLGILQDITDRRNATSQLARSEELYRTAIEVAGAVPYYQLYDSDTYQFMGEGIQEIVGCPAEEFNGYFEDHILEVVPRGELQGLSYLDAVMKCRSDGTVWKADYRIRRPDGSERWLSNSAVQVRDENGRVVASLGILQDITERIRAEEESRNLEAQIQQAQKLESLGVLAGGIAHDFNNLLMGILGNTSLARSEAGTDPSLCEYLEQIELASQRAADLTNQMLAYSGRGKFIIRNFNLNDLVREMTSLLESSISKKASLTLDLARDLPDVEGDATQIRQVVMNLITNASDSLEDRSGKITLITGVIQADREYFANAYTPENFREGEYIFLEVRDTGCGMDRETQRRIFEPFFTTKFTGRGLGLSAILGIVRGHKGALSVYSERGQGTTMKILLPTPDRKRPTESLLLQPGFDPNWRGTGTVLVVDDEITVRNVTKRMLAKAGLEALTAADGEEGLKVFLSNRETISLVILDMTMPRMDGAEAFEQIRQIDAQVPVLLMSGYSEAEATRKFEASGLSGYLQKPFGTSTLLAKIQSILKT